MYRSLHFWRYLLFLLFVVFCLPVYAKYGGGSGEPNDPYLIATVKQLQVLGQAPEDWDRHFRLTSDINLSGLVYDKAVIAWTIDGIADNFDGTVFTGSFDGAGHAIQDLTINTGSVAKGYDYLGLFGYLGVGAIVSNLRLEGIHIQGGTNSDYVGGLAGCAHRATIENCRVSGVITSELNAQFLGGLVGNGEDVDIKSCRLDGTVQASDGSSFIGGMIGSFSGRVLDCHAEGQVQGGALVHSMGGLVGHLHGATLSKCTVDSSVSGDAGSQFIGGIMGYGVGVSVVDCNATAVVDAGSTSLSVGGIAGHVQSGILMRCRTQMSGTGDTQSDSIGGVAGWAYRTTLTECTSVAEISGETGTHFMGGLLGMGIRVSLDQCSAQGTIGGGSISYGLGGLAGYLTSSDITQCFSEASVAGEPGAYGIGGLVGQCHSSRVMKCYSVGPVSGGVNSDYLGGLIGDYQISDVLTADGMPVVVDCHSSSTVTGSANSDHVGGLIGDVGRDSVVYNCFATGAVHGEEEVGGLIGWNDGEISQCYATGAITTEYDADRVGGLIGRNADGFVESCYASGGITGAYNSDHLGGLVGKNEGLIYTCYATGAVSGGLGAEDVGGLVGYNTRSVSHIEHCYATGRVTTQGELQFAGALVGTHNNGHVVACFWNQDTAGLAVGVGSWRQHKPQVAGLTTEKMREGQRFIDAGWQLIDLVIEGPYRHWFMQEGYPRPLLRWERESKIELPVFAGGSGTSEDPYLIADANDLIEVTYSPRLLAKHFKLVADIDSYSSDVFPGIGYRYSPFVGSFDGNHHQITQLKRIITKRNDILSRRRFGDPIGLFGTVDGEASIRNLSLSVQLEDFDCPALGGLVGCLKQGTLSNCHLTGELHGQDYVGGLVGINYHGSIVDSSAIMAVDGDDDIGGLIGHNQGKVSTCYTRGSVAGDKRIGGLVGVNEDVISNCYSTCSITADEHVGGLIGYHYRDAFVTHCYSAGAVTGDHSVGGLVGSSDGEMIGSVWDMESSTQTNGANGLGMTTQAMFKAETCLALGWDFVDEVDNGTDDIWWIDEGENYPKLWWEQ